MVVSHTFGTDLLMILTCANCWGFWANTFKGVKNYRFELFYWDYALGIFLIAVALAFTMGSTSNDASSFLNNVRAADRSNRSEEHTSELQSHLNLVCRLLLEKKKAHRLNR